MQFSLENMTMKEASQIRDGISVMLQASADRLLQLLSNCCPIEWSKCHHTVVVGNGEQAISSAIPRLNSFSDPSYPSCATGDFSTRCASTCGNPTGSEERGEICSNVSGAGRSSAAQLAIGVLSCNANYKLPNQIA